MTKDEKIAALERRVAELTNTILSMEGFAREAEEGNRSVLECVKSVRMLGLVGTERMALR